MRSIANFTVSLIRFLLGLFVLLVAASIPAYFVSVDKEAVVVAGKGGASTLSVARVYFDASKFSSALLIADSIGEGDELKREVKSIYASRPNLKIAGGDEPFFDAYLSTLSSSQKLENGALYSILSLGENRKKLLNYLSHSHSGLVGKFIELRKMSSTILPPVYTSAGAPLDAALLSSALLAQTGDFSQEFLKDLSNTFEAMKSDTSQKDKFEKYCVGMLTLISAIDWTLTRSVVSHFKSLDEVYDFAKIYKNALSSEMRNLFVAGVLVRGNVSACVNYLTSADEQTWRDFSYALINGDGALQFLLDRNLPIYKNSFLAKHIEFFAAPIKSWLGGYAKDFPIGLLVLKIAMSIFGGYLLIRGLIRMFAPNRDTLSWSSPLAITRGLLEGVVVSLFFFIFLEPDAFTIKVENASAPELKFAFDKITNTIQEETMKFESDTATLAAVGLFFVLQFTVYILSIIRLAVIRRTVAPAKLKLKLLENEDNLFDLGLYIGLAGTVVSLVLLTMGVVTASLMAAYMSTLFGILFTAMIKIVHVRKYKRQLLFDAENED